MDTNQKDQQKKRGIKTKSITRQQQKKNDHHADQREGEENSAKRRESSSKHGSRTRRPSQANGKGTNGGGNHADIHSTKASTIGSVSAASSQRNAQGKNRPEHSKPPIPEDNSYMETKRTEINQTNGGNDQRDTVIPNTPGNNENTRAGFKSQGLTQSNMSQRQTCRQTINQYLPRQTRQAHQKRDSLRMTQRLSQKQRPTQSRLTVDEDDELNICEEQNSEDEDYDEDIQNMDEYDDIVRDTLHNDDQTSLLFKNILKKQKFGSSSKGSFLGAARESVLSGGGGSGRNSYTSRFSSKYGDNRLYLQRLSRHSIDSNSGLHGERTSQEYKMKIRPKPRNYNHDDLDESYFAANSAEDGNCSREEAYGDSTPDGKTDFFKTPKREFKIFERKLDQKNFASNEIQTAKYSGLSFIPQNLVEQLSNKVNLYFWVIMLMQMIPQISITDGQPTILLGLIPVIVINMIMDSIEDTKKQAHDLAENEMKVQRIEPKEHGFINDQSKNLKVGQVIKVNQNERFPADLILLKSSNPNGIAYVETESLDGEMNLKHKSAIRDMQDAILSPADASTINGHIFCDQPNDYLYNFDGMMSIKVKNSDDSYKYALGYNQLLQRGSSLKTTHWIYGIVVYTGNETKIQQHEAAKRRLQAPAKTSKMDKLMNKFVGYMLAIEVALAGFAAYEGVKFEQRATQSMKYLVGPDGVSDLIDVQMSSIPTIIAQNFPQIIYLIKFGNWILLLMNFIPISLLVTVNIVKFFQAKFIEWDTQMFSVSRGFEPTVHHSQMAEELGQVSYVVADKTGTITQNQMEFRKMSIGGVSYGQNHKDCEDAHLKDVTNFNMVDSDLNKAIKFQINPQYEQIQRFLYHLALCHTVLTIKNPKDESMRPIMSSTSPDELALINAAKYYGIKFIERNQFNELIIENVHHQQSQLYKYELLNVIEYNSERKRMSVIVKAPNGEIKVLCKGADSVLAPLLSDNEQCQDIKYQTMDDLYDYAKDGLRTLMICERVIPTSFYKSWVYKYEQAKTAINHKQLKIQNVVSEIERDFELLGVTAVEDVLQDRATETITAIKDAGMKFWMLTGDNIETAVNVGFSCRLLDSGTQIFRIEQQSKQDIMNYLTMVLKNIQKQERRRIQALREGLAYPEYATILSGESFFKIQQSLRLTDCFMELALTSRILIACRLTPMQKSEIVQLIREYQPKVTVLAVGDGINDANMMNAAHIAVSINGNQAASSSLGGNHALRNSDYALGQFKHLRTLLLCHGRESYRKNSYVILYIFYKNLLFSAPLFLYGIYSGFSGMNTYEIWMTQLFNVAFTSLPIIFYGVMDQEYDKETLFRNPKLYEDGPENACVTTKMFIRWLLYTFIQAAIIFYTSYSAMLNAPEIYGSSTDDSATFKQIQSGKTADWVLIGSVLYAAVVIFVNLRLLQDSSSFSWQNIFINFASSAAFFVAFYVFNLYPENDLYLHFNHIWHYPQYLLCILFFALSMWPIDSFLYMVQHQTKKEEQLQEIEDNSYKKEKHRFERDQQDIDERQQILKDQQRETMRGSIGSASIGKYTQHSGFAFAGEEGHVPQIIDNLKSYS